MRSRSKHRKATFNLNPNQRKERGWRGLKQMKTASCPNLLTRSRLVCLCGVLSHWDDAMLRQQTYPSLSHLTFHSLWPSLASSTSCYMVCLAMPASSVLPTPGQSKRSEKGTKDGTSTVRSTAGSAATSSQTLPSFWIPSLTPEAKPTMLRKPVSGFSYRVQNTVPDFLLSAICLQPRLHLLKTCYGQMIL